MTLVCAVSLNNSVIATSVADLTMPPRVLRPTETVAVEHAKKKVGQTQFYNEAAQSEVELQYAESSQHDGYSINRKNEEGLVTTELPQRQTKTKEEIAWQEYVQRSLTLLTEERHRQRGEYYLGSLDFDKECFWEEILGKAEITPTQSSWLEYVDWQLMKITGERRLHHRNYSNSVPDFENHSWDEISSNLERDIKRAGRDAAKDFKRDVKRKYDKYWEQRGREIDQSGGSYEDRKMRRNIHDMFSSDPNVRRKAKQNIENEKRKREVGGFYGNRVHSVRRY